MIARLTGGIEIFEGIVLPERRERRTAYGLMVVACVGAITYALVYELSVLVVAVPVGTLSVVLLIQQLLPSKVLSLLANPERIVWYYPSPKHSLTVMIGDDRGKVCGVGMTTIERVEQALETLARLAPHARAGYSEDARRAYKKNPKSFLRSHSGQ
jgi:hypothetical protein